MGNIFRKLSSYFVYERVIIYNPALEKPIYDRNKNYNIYEIYELTGDSKLHSNILSPYNDKDDIHII
jgi:hypothetical protein